jgi:8-oxo-dGTP pyrophosphatase MutT (NUDIX family)
LIDLPIRSDHSYRALDVWLICYDVCVEIKYCGGGILLNPHRQLLIITNQIGRTTLPKGGCEDRELFVDTALREISQESGIPAGEITIVGRLGMLTRQGFTAENPNTPSVEKRIEMYLAVTGETVFGPLVADVVSRQWVSPDPDLLSTMLTWPEERQFVAGCMAAIGTVRLAA